MRLLKNILTIIVVFCLLCGCSANSNENKKKHDLYLEVKEIINENLSDYNPNVEYDESKDMITIKVLAPKGTANSMVVNPNAIKDDWKTFTTAMKGISSAGYEMSLERDIKVACAVMILNDENTNNILYSAMNGVEVSNELSRWLWMIFENNDE